MSVKGKTMTIEELEEERRILSEEVHGVLENVKAYEKLWIEYKMSQLSIKIGDTIMVGGKEHIFGGYHLPNEQAYFRSIEVRKPVIILYNFKKDGSAYKHFIISRNTEEIEKNYRVEEIV